jgi:ferrochelatase
MSFHGIPQPYADKGDPYADQCPETARLVAQALGLEQNQWAIRFFSRVLANRNGLKLTYTDQLLGE